LAWSGAASAEIVNGQATTIWHPTLQVSGEGMVEVAPDTARVTASIITEGESVEAARGRNAQIVQKAMAAVEALKLPNVSTKTLNYTLERVTQDVRVTLKAEPEKWDIPWTVAGAQIQGTDFVVSVPVTLGYRASNSLTVRIQGTREELSAATSKIVDALMGAGTNQITSVNYTLEKDEGAAMREAMAKAVKNAQMTAEAVAAAAGRKIVGVRSINPSYYRPETYQYRQAAMQAPMGGGAPTPITAGMLQVTAQVNINYELDYNPGDTKFLPAP
jgi:hypothetical protein